MTPKNRQNRRQRDSDKEEIDRLNDEIRTLKAINRSLLRRLKKVDREYHKALEEDQEEPVVVKPKLSIPKCPECSEGELIVTKNEGINRQWKKCNNCRYRTPAEKMIL